MPKIVNLDIRILRHIFCSTTKFLKKGGTIYANNQPYP